MKCSGQTPIQYDWCPYERGKFGPRDRHAHREDDVKIQGENGHLQAKERGLEQILPSQLSEGASHADTLILDF